MARSREFDTDKALDNAMALFWEKGYESSSFDDIVKATGVSRYGIYDEFKSKKGLYLAVLDHYFVKIILPAMKPINHATASVKDFKPLFDNMIAVDRGAGKLEDGCLLCHGANEMARQDPEIRDFLSACFEKIQRAFAQAIQNSVNAGELDKDIDVDATAWVVFGLLEGGATFARCSMSEQQLKDYTYTGLDLIFNPIT